MTPQITPAIHRHAKSGNLPALAAELAKKVPIDLPNPDNNRTPLMEAVAGKNANLELIQFLLQHGASANASGFDPSLPTPEILDQIAAILDAHAGEMPELSERIDIKSLIPNLKNVQPRIENPLSLAISAGNPEIIQTLLEAGANIHYMKPNHYDALIDAMHGRPIAHDPNLIPILKLLIARSATLNTISDYSESALSVASNNGRFDAIQVLLQAGADPAPLEWTPLMHAVALGSLDDVKSQLCNNPDLNATDFWSRTPFLLSLQTGDVEKATFLLAAGSNRKARGRCGKTPLMHPVASDDDAMLRWLLSQNFDPDETNDFGQTPLLEAAQSGAHECAELLIEAGADIRKAGGSQTPINSADNLEIVQLLVQRGADLNDISKEMRAALARQRPEDDLDISEQDYLAAKTRTFGTSNPEKMNRPFWIAMTKIDAQAYAARRLFNDFSGVCGDGNESRTPIWSPHRYGKSINLLPDGTVIQIAGEHEDYYDPDFCIYNDVTVHHPDGSIDIYGYPKEIFPPTDFHTATLVENQIYIVGSLGYHEERNFGQTPVHRLNLQDFQIQKIETTGDNPGWISHHKAALLPTSQIQITGGKIALNDNTELHNNPHAYLLNLATLTWRKLP